jgi:hypothetical protein
MKTLKIVPALILAAFASVAVAEVSPYEITVGVTQSRLDSFKLIDDADRSQTGFTVGLSTQLSGDFKGQVSYTKDAAGFDSDYIDGSVDTLGLGVRYTPWKKYCIEPFVDLGVNVNIVDLEIPHSDLHVSGTSAAPYFGIGASWNIDKENALALQYHRSWVEANVIDKNVNYDQIALTYSRRF